jgi:acetyl-CoA carboxylase biotin carboxyl carrier protein
MDIKDLKVLIKMVTETDITEFEMEGSEERIVIRRGKNQEIVHMTTPVYAPAPALAQPQASPVQNAPAPGVSAQAPSSAPAVIDDKYETVTSPIVGTFYRAPSPESGPYVEIGTVVDKGGTFCIVEAMKLMNEIEAEFKCKVVEILKENAQPVEFGEPLFRVERL